MEKPLTLEELMAVVKTMANNKTPACDGLLTQFYKTFWENLGSMLLDVFIVAKNQGKLNKSARRGIISLIPINDCDPLYVKN